MRFSLLFSENPRTSMPFGLVAALRLSPVMDLMNVEAKVVTNEDFAHQVTVCVLPAVHTVPAVGDVMGGSITSLTDSGSALARVAKAMTMAMIIGVIANIVNVVDGGPRAGRSCQAR